MARKIILKEDGIGDSNAPSGYRYVGYYGTTFSERSSSELSFLKTTGVSGDYLPLAGGTMSGDIFMSPTTQIKSSSGAASISLENTTFSISKTSNFKGVTYSTGLYSVSQGTFLSSSTVTEYNYYISTTTAGAEISAVYGNEGLTGSEVISFHNQLQISTYDNTSTTSIVVESSNLLVNLDPANGVLYLNYLKIFADNDSAVVGGLTANAVYKTATGELRIVV